MSGVTVLHWRPLVRGALRGFAKLIVPINTNGSAVILYDCPAYARNGKRWVSPPSKPQLDNGALRCDATGKPLYAPVVEFNSRALTDRFSDAAVTAIEAKYPDAFRGEAA